MGIEKKKLIKKGKVEKLTLNIVQLRYGTEAEGEAEGEEDGKQKIVEEKGKEEGKKTR